ncbi:MAG: trigger factor [Anaerolineae bacterium]|nr:trigger factor [Anaerolineae bacterium]MDW8171352.1 trigger factor [Anaerolineae bacterium]
MNIQTEPQENHTLRLVVEVPAERLEVAKANAAKKLANRLKIPGFRQGKAPYNVITKYLGEATILEEAVELLSNEIYGQVIQELDIKTYGPGSVENISYDPLTFVYSVSLQPEVELGDYRAVRVPYEPPTVSDEDVENVFKTLQRQHAQVEAREGAAEEGDRLTADIHAVFVDGDELAEGAERNAEKVYRGDPFFHQHNAKIDLNLENKPILPGFAAAMLGVQVGETREFDLNIPNDEGFAEKIRGRTVHFEVTAKAVEKVVLPTLDDEFAAKLTQDEGSPLTMEQLRERVRLNMEAQSAEDYDKSYGERVFEQIMAQARVKYPPRMVEARIDEMLRDTEERFKRDYRLDLNEYYKITGTNQDSMREQMRADAEAWVVRSLVMSELVEREQIKLYMHEVDAVLDASVARMNVSVKDRRRFKGEQRANVANYLLMNRVMFHLVALGRGASLPVLNTSEAPTPDPVVAEGEVRQTPSDE